MMDDFSLRSSSAQKLVDWFGVCDVIRTKFARELGVAPSTISDLCNGRRRPSLDLAVRIEKRTAGAVPAAEWL